MDDSYIKDYKQKSIFIVYIVRHFKNKTSIIAWNIKNSLRLHTSKVSLRACKRSLLWLRNYLRVVRSFKHSYIHVSKLLCN